MNARLSLLVLLAATACRSAPTDAELDAALGARALALANAMEAGDYAAAAGVAAPEARGFFEAEGAFRALLLEREPREPSPVALREVERDGDRGVAIVDVGGGDEGRAVFLHFVRVDDTWGAVGFARGRDDEPRRFATLEADAQARLAEARAETTPHPELGPIVEAYVAASKARDVAGMTAAMTAECAAAERDGRNAFTRGFAAGEYSIDAWQFSGHDVDGDEVTQRIRTRLKLASGEFDGEPLRFSFRRVGDGWKITAIR